MPATRFQAQHTEYQELVKSMQADDEPLPAQQQKLNQQLVSAAIAFETAKAYQTETAKSGEPQAAKRKAVLERLADQAIDREYQSHGLAWLNRPSLKRQAIQNLEDALD